MFSHPTARNRPGFTLIELLVVVAIIALLISILLPSLSRAREAARTVACSANMKTFTNADHMYANDEDGYLVPHKTAGPAGEYDAWYGNPKFLNLIGTEAAAWAANIPEGLLCPNIPDENIGSDGRGLDYKSYASNTTVIPRIPEDGGWNAFMGFKDTDIRQPTEKIRFVDAPWWSTTWTGANYNAYYDVDGEMVDAGMVAYRHNNLEGANMAHVDGHVSYYTKEEAYDEPLNNTAMRDRMWYLNR